jgi:hypothetical protein
MRVFIDPRIDTASLRQAMAASLQSAVILGEDIRVSVFDSTQPDDFVPPRLLSLRDYHSSIAWIFKGQADRDRAKEGAQRVEAALKSFDEYMRNVAPAPGKCTQLLRMAHEIADGPEKTVILLLSDKVCTAPRVRLPLPPERGLVVMLAAGAAPDGASSDCAFLQRERRLHASFPQAAIIPVVGADSLVQIISNRSAWRASERLVVYPCGPQNSLPHQVGSSAPRVPHAVGAVGDPGSEPGSALRVMWPRPRAHVARVFPFQGDGAMPGEVLLPVVQVGDEYWPDNEIRADPVTGSFSGEAIAGRPFNDCGVHYVLRVFRNVGDKVIVGRPLGSWPQGDASLPVEVIRTEECGASM